MKNAVRTMKDHELLHSTKTLVAREREITTEVLRHLAEIERRKLYCDVAAASGLKYGSLFDYAVRELGYSEAAADRRIKAMRMVREIPEVEEKIQSGALTLSNIAQASRFFREMSRKQSTEVESGRVEPIQAGSGRIAPTHVMSREEKAAVLEKLEQKSAREGERVLLAMSPEAALPRERVRQIDLTHTELRFTVDAKLKAKLREVRSLMGPRGGLLSLAELVSEMAAMSAQHLAEKKFGKRRVQAELHSDVGVRTQSRASDLETPSLTSSTHSDVGVKNQARAASDAGSRVLAAKSRPATSPNPSNMPSGARLKASARLAARDIIFSSIMFAPSPSVAHRHPTTFSCFAALVIYEEE